MGTEKTAGTNGQGARPEVEAGTEAAAVEAAPETAVETGGGEDTAALRESLEEARAKAQENWDLLLRAQAELENQRRRLQKDVENARNYGLEKFALELLPVKDSLERGLEAAAGGSAEVASLRDGMALTLKMLQGAMEKFGLREVDPLGQPFDPELHEAMTMQASDEVAPGHVMAVIQKGCTLNDRLVRAAMVVVASEGAHENA